MELEKPPSRSDLAFLEVGEPRFVWRHFLEEKDSIWLAHETDEH